MTTYVIEFIAVSAAETDYEEVEAETEHQARMRLIAKHAPEKIEIAAAWPKNDDYPG